jgi:D-serine deaminase-like pyridoxal phosphate-dependent protein
MVITPKTTGMDHIYRLQDTSNLQSPSLLFYPHIIERNIDTAVRLAGGPGRLRPHIKTSKSADVVSLMAARGIRKFKCATMAEAQLLGTVGVEDVVIAYQLLGPAIGLYFDIRNRFPETTYKSIVDSRDALLALANEAQNRGETAEVMIDLDVGMNRTGIPPGKPAFELYRLIADTPGVAAAGIHAYDGHVHESDRGKRAAIAADIYKRTTAFRYQLETAGLPVPEIILGGTPTFTCYAEYPDVTFSPGTCILQDGGYLDLFPDLQFQPAALVFGRIISVPGKNIITIDCGSKAVSSDSVGARGRILNIEGTIPGRQNEEHWVFSCDAAADESAIGDNVYILPTHICTTVALYGHAVTVGRNREVTGSWSIGARDRLRC